MEKVKFSEYLKAKRDIIGGVEYKEHSTLDGNQIRKTYVTEKNGNFYEVTENGCTEFWSDKHAESRIYEDGICFDEKLHRAFMRAA
jgi:hypothetical protein